jgi:hypothetical protein
MKSDGRLQGNEIPLLTPFFDYFKSTPNTQKLQNLDVYFWWLLKWIKNCSTKLECLTKVVLIDRCILHMQAGCFSLASS